MARLAASAAAADRLGFANVLVTGADGFVGRRFVPELALRLPPGARLCLTTRDGVVEGGRPTGEAFELTEPGTVSALVRRLGPDLIVHLAGYAVAGGPASDPVGAWAVNFGGAFALARAVRDFAPDGTLLFVSSAQVYGRAFDRGPADEDVPPEPISAYARSKAAAEAMLLDVLPTSRRLVVVRPTNHFGPGQSADFVAPAFASQIARLERQGGGRIAVGGLTAGRDFLGVGDVVAAYLALLRGAPALPARATFNVASGRLTTVGELLETLLSMSGARIEVVADPSLVRPGEIRRAAVDAARLQAATGWRPAESLDEMLRAVLEDWRAAYAAD
jgi:GDP-4-dehydro-6-deoxy-D-mannose reductase